ncbi:MAG TPA: hypothetical protein VIL48_05710 [Acidimicrobiales bacterium]
MYRQGQLGERELIERERFDSAVEAALAVTAWTAIAGVECEVDGLPAGRRPRDRDRNLDEPQRRA